MSLPHEVERTAWLRDIGEASLLPPDDPGRQQVEDEVARRGGWAEAQWLALLALNDHLDTHGLEVEDEAALVAGLQPLVPFPLRLPPIGEVVRSVGGRRCTLGSHPVAFTMWTGAGGAITAIQLRPEDFGLPDPLPATRVRPAGQAARARPLEVLLWVDGGVGWVFVADDPADLGRIESALPLPTK